MAERLNATVRYGAYLPHWTKDGATYSVQFRLADSLPQHLLRQWREERQELQQKLSRGECLSKGEQERLQHLFSERAERFLQNGYGSCWFTRDNVANIMKQTLLRYDRIRYEFSAWCIMPNHVHAIFRPLGHWTLAEILKNWKEVSARRINKLLRRSGSLWQPESFDHLIRNEEDFQGQVNYIWSNPDVAGLKDWKWRWRATGLE